MVLTKLQKSVSEAYGRLQRKNVAPEMAIVAPLPLHPVPVVLQPLRHQTHARVTVLLCFRPD